MSFNEGFGRTKRAQQHKGRCGCEMCKATRVRRMAPTEHGTLKGHSNGCRCEKCVDVKRRYDAARYAAKKAASS